MKEYRIRYKLTGTGSLVLEQIVRKKPKKNLIE